MGGLTVLKELAQRFPDENFIYLGDTARLPYGSKSSSTVYRYAVQNIDYLRNQNCKAIIAACNSASSSLLSEREDDFELPIINVIEPACQLTETTTTTNQVGLLGTRSTISQLAYQNILGVSRPDIKITAVACPLFVPFIEEGLTEDPLTNLIIHRYISSFKNTSIDTVILGCTHYPLIKESIQKILGNHVKLIDSAPAVADVLQHKMGANIILPRGPEDTSRQINLHITDINSEFDKIAPFFLSPVSYDQITLVSL